MEVKVAGGRGGGGSQAEAPSCFSSQGHPGLIGISGTRRGFTSLRIKASVRATRTERACGRDPDGTGALPQMFSPSAHRHAVASGEVLKNVSPVTRVGVGG